MPKISSNPITLAVLQAEATKKIGAADSIWLLSALLGVSRAELILNREQNIPNALTKKYRTWLKRRERGEPLQYIAGSAPFYGREFYVDRSVLIPRPETETLIELALEYGDRMAAALAGRLCVIDVGAGSGIIPITLGLERGRWEISAGELSAAALRVARKNVRRHNANVKLYRGNLLDAWPGAIDADMIVANLPYVAKGREWVAADVLRWEPHLALFPQRNRKSSIKNTGAHLAERFIEQAIARARNAKLILLELSASVAYDLERRFRREAIVARIERRPDLAGRKRFLIIELKAR